MESILFECKVFDKHGSLVKVITVEEIREIIRFKTPKLSKKELHTILSLDLDGNGEFLPRNHPSRNEV